MYFFIIYGVHYDNISFSEFPLKTETIEPVREKFHVDRDHPQNAFRGTSAGEVDTKLFFYMVHPWIAVDLP